MPHKSKKQIVEDFNEAMFQFIQFHHPEDFKQAYFTILCISGRLDEATGYLNQYMEEHKKE